LTCLARLRADVSKGARVVAVVLFATTTACNKLPTPTVNLNAGTTFVPQVADSIDNVGLGNQVTLDQNGIPYVSYVGIPAVYTAKQIPVTRLPSQPFVPGILIASVDKGIWTRGAAAEAAGLGPPGSNSGNPVAPHIPFGPFVQPSLKTSLRTATQNGTSIAVGSNGSVNVAWTDASGVWFDDSSSGASGTMATPVNILPVAHPLKQSGPVGWPSVAVNTSGAPSVAVTTTTPKGQAVEYLAPRPGSSGHWKRTVIATFGRCGAKCEQPQRTVNLQTSSGPAILYVDTTTHAVMEATQRGGKWATQTVEKGVSGQGLAATVAPDGSIVASYYTGKGEVHVASQQGSAWRVSTAGTETDASLNQIALATTGVAVDGKGTVYVTWYDAADDSVKLVSGDGNTFTAMTTVNTQHSGAPSLAVTKDGSVQLAWYAETPQDLYFGSLESTSGLALAQPSPTPSPAAAATSAPSTCPSKSLDVTAAVGASTSGYQTTKVTAPSGSFSICFNNADSGVPHDVNVTTDPTELHSLGHTPIAPGPNTSTLNLTGLKPGTYYFHCDVHPTIMKGTLTVK
jgi:plastocyanin